MKIKIESIRPYQIAYIRKVGPYGTDNIKTMERLKTWAKSNDLFNDESILLGIAHDDPQTTKPEACRYDTCFVVPEGCFVNDDDISHGNLEGGRYAVFEVNHTAEAVEKAWIEIFPALTKKGHRFDEARPILERYKVKLIKKHFCEICVPIH